ncbi:ScbA/BarX family gamma-butyrolactone biosynthesis protein [Streptomyces sp. NPDC001770]
MHVIPGLEVPAGRHPGPERHWKGMNFGHFVPRESVHKSADAEVLLTDALLLDDGSIAVAARWRRSHYLGHHGGCAADPVLLAETARQTAIHLSHRFFGIGHGSAFVLSELSVDLDEALPPVGTEPLAVGLHSVCRGPAAGERRLRFELEADVLAGSRRFGRVRVCWEPMDPRRYAVVRKRGGGRHGPGLDGQPAPRVRVDSSERDVLIDGDPLRPDVWWLRLDLEHGVLFDHESDHVPGMALVEAFRQAGAAAAGGGPWTDGTLLLAVEFKAFGELDAPVSITAEPAGLDGTALTLRACQGDRELACARVRFGAGEPSPARRGTTC